jgi:hypothetical protein
MTRHAIDAARLQADQRTASVAVGDRRIRVHDPYAKAKSLLLGEVASASGGQVVVHPADRMVTLFGGEGELEAIELLYTSLLVQGTAAMLRAGRPPGHPSASSTAAFRRSFLSAFALRIGQRLRDASSTAAASATRPGELVPLLARRDEAIARAVDEAFPHARTSPALRLTSPTGVAAGAAAADDADLHAGGSRLEGAAHDPGSTR